MVQNAPPGPAAGAMTGSKPPATVRTGAGVTTRAAATRPSVPPTSDVFTTVSAAAAAATPASAAVVAALALAAEAPPLPPTAAAQTAESVPTNQPVPAPATPARASVTAPAPAAASMAPPATPKKKKKADREYEGLASLSNEALIRLIMEKDSKHAALLDQYNKMNKRLERVENLRVASTTTTATVAAAGAAAPSAPASTSAQPGLNTIAFPALGDLASTATTLPRLSYLSADALAHTAVHGEDARTRARAALAPRRATTIREGGGDGPRDVPAEVLAPLFVKIAWQPIRGLLQALQQLRIPTSLIHDYAFVRENTLQMIAIKDGRERLIAALRHEGIEVFDEFDPTRPRHEDASAAEHDYARERFRRVAASSIAHAEKQGSLGVARLFQDWLKQMETAHKTSTPAPASISVPTPASTSAAAPTPTDLTPTASTAHAAATSPPAPGTGSAVAPQGPAELAPHY